MSGSQDLGHDANIFFRLILTLGEFYLYNESQTDTHCTIPTQAPRILLEMAINLNTVTLVQELFPPTPRAFGLLFNFFRAFLFVGTRLQVEASTPSVTS